MTHSDHAPLVDMAITYGLLKYDTHDQLSHMPIVLDPYLVSQLNIDTMKNSSQIYADLLMTLPQAFLEKYLEPLLLNDPFINVLLRILRSSPENAQPYRQAIGRNDFFIASSGTPKQVEFNTVSVSFPMMSECMVNFHTFLESTKAISRLPLENPIAKEITQCFLDMFQYYAFPNSVLLMVVQPNERNIFDQLAIEKLLFRQAGIRAVRATLEDIGRYGILRHGHMYYNNFHVGVAYFRAGYAPEDYQSEEAIQGRILLENSDAIKIPDMQYQLAGMKVIQAVLTDESILQSHLSCNQSREYLAATSVYTRPLDNKDAYEKVFRHPDNFVVKPQREGGGNNFFGTAISSLLNDPSIDFSTYVAMERIHPELHNAQLVINNKVQPPVPCASEIGWYTLTHAMHGAINTDIAGYLVRTKPATENEGGVCAGYAALNSLTLK
ncbi:hypothetical protein [Chrysiogenes arsenatis]|uniref:hypothetical protein n=1 Tax=Chrysiogenes arsenatis TaxID=309797 RepID=UPI000484CED9|nr:hypothetical protein [Chrysiogenes arsenatis]